MMPGRGSIGLVAFRMEIEVLGTRLVVAFGVAIKRDHAACESIFRPFGRQHAPLRFEPRDDIDEAERVPQLERPQLVGIAPAHGAIDLDNAVRDFGDHLGRVQETGR